MLIGVSEATTKIPASATMTAAPPTTSGTPAATSEPNTNTSAKRRQRQRHELAAAQVGFRDGLDVAVEGRATRQLDGQPGRVMDALAQDRQRLRRIVGRQVEEHDVVGGVAVGRHLAWREQVRHDPGDVWRARDVADRVGRRGLEGRRAGLEGRAREDHHERRGRRPERRLEKCLGARGFEVVEDEPAGAQLARHLGGERDGHDEQREPRRDDPPCAAHDETPESIEWGHVAGSPRSRRWLADRPIVPATAVPGVRAVC